MFHPCTMVCNSGNVVRKSFQSFIQGGKSPMKNEEKLLKYNQKWGFGMAPLKSKTEYKYKKAAYSVLKILTGNQESEIDLDDISTFKGMVNRCVKQNQWDWFTVYTKFGEPSPLKLRRMPSFLTELRNALKNSNNNEFNRLIKSPLAFEIIGLCKIFLNEEKAKQSQSETGYVYILSKREEPKVLKIGMTNRNVEQRVKEINSATGVVFPLSVRRIFKVNDARSAEKMVFEALDYYRIRKDREFFMIDYAFAVKLISELLKKHNFLTE